MSFFASAAAKPEGGNQTQRAIRDVIHAQVHELRSEEMAPRFTGGDSSAIVPANDEGPTKKAGPEIPGQPEDVGMRAGAQFLVSSKSSTITQLPAFATE